MINDLELKLEGKLPITRIELIELVNSWGRKDFFTTYDNIFVDECNPNECYPLENLNVSEITDLSYIFRDSPYNGDLSKWDVSNCNSIKYMFYESLFDNNSISNWNISNITNSSFCFSNSIFNYDLSKWDISNIENTSYMFFDAQFNKDISSWKFNKNIVAIGMFTFNNNFENKYNKYRNIPNETQEFLEWFEENRLKIANLNVTKEDILEIDDYLNIYIENKLIHT